MVLFPVRRFADFSAHASCALHNTQAPVDAAVTKTTLAMMTSGAILGDPQAIDEAAGGEVAQRFNKFLSVGGPLGRL
jgi:hypothetical protein